MIIWNPGSSNIVRAPYCLSFTILSPSETTVDRSYTNILPSTGKEKRAKDKFIINIEGKLSENTSMVQRETVTEMATYVNSSY